MAKNKDRVGAAENAGMRLAYDDLRTWLSEAERLGELKTVRGANWAEEIGMATELVSHSDKAPAVIFDDIPGCRKGLSRPGEYLWRQAQEHDVGFSNGA